MEAKVELLSNLVDLGVGLVLLLLYFLEVPFVVEYIWQIVLVLFGIRYIIGKGRLTQILCL